MSTDYDGGNIRVPEGLEAVRVRPGMYIGSTGSRGLHHLVYGVVDNSIEEALAGHCENIDISINANGSMTTFEVLPTIADAIIATAIKASDAAEIARKERELIRCRSKENKYK